MMLTSGATFTKHHTPDHQPTPCPPTHPPTHTHAPRPVQKQTVLTALGVDIGVEKQTSPDPVLLAVSLGGWVLGGALTVGAALVLRDERWRR